MNINRPTVNIIVICMVLLLTCLIFYLNASLSDEKKTIETVNEVNVNYELDLMIKQMISYQDLKLDSVLIYEDGIFSSFKDIVFQNILVLFYPQHFCGECTEYDLDSFKKLSDQYPEQTILISTQLQKRELLFFTKEHELNCKYYNVHLPANDLLDDLHEPCYFLVDKDLSLSLFFNPDMSQKEMTDFYFSKAEMILNN